MHHHAQGSHPLTSCWTPGPNVTLALTSLTLGVLNGAATLPESAVASFNGMERLTRSVPLAAA